MFVRVTCNGSGVGAGPGRGPAMQPFCRTIWPNHLAGDGRGLAKERIKIKKNKKMLFFFLYSPLLQVTRDKKFFCYQSIVASHSDKKTNENKQTLFFLWPLAIKSGNLILFSFGFVVFWFCLFFGFVCCCCFVCFRCYID